MNHYAVRPAGTAFYWRIVNVATGKVIVDAISDRMKAIRMADELNANRIKREEAIGAGA